MTIARHATGIAGLDRLLGGGLFAGGVYLIAGRPGAGKTLLSNQIAFNHVEQGGRVLYVTLLAESHARMLALMEPMSFFRSDRVGAEIQYISGYQVLEKDKLAGLVRMLRTAVRDHRASLIVLDGLLTATDLADTEIELKKFIHELQVLAELGGCTTLLLRGAHDSEHSYPERTMADGLIALSVRRSGMRAVREIEIQKHRGTAHISGSSFFEISAHGLSIYPRTEARFGFELASKDQAPVGAVSTGVDSLDRALHGGLPAGSATMLIGAPGSGKTLLGLHFLEAGALLGQPSLYVGFSEPPGRLLRKANAIGLDLTPHVTSGMVELGWHSPQEPIADHLAEVLFDNVERRQVRRVFIDGIEGFQAGLVYPERALPFTIALDNELRSRGVTSILSQEVPGLFGRDIDVPPGASEIVDNIVFMRHAATGSQIRRMLSVIKMRDQAYDTSELEFEITAAGMTVAGVKRASRAKAVKAKGRTARHRKPG